MTACVSNIQSIATTSLVQPSTTRYGTIHFAAFSPFPRLPSSRFIHTHTHPKRTQTSVLNSAEKQRLSFQPQGSINRPIESPQLPLSHRTKSVVGEFNNVVVSGFTHRDHIACQTDRSYEFKDRGHEAVKAPAAFPRNPHSTRLFCR